MTDTEHRAPAVVPTIDELLEMAQEVSAGHVTREEYFAACRLRADQAVEDATERFMSDPSHGWDLRRVRDSATDR